MNLPIKYLWELQSLKHINILQATSLLLNATTKEQLIYFYSCIY